jgi:hypothetical protein
MPTISEKNKKKIKEQILQILFENNLNSLYTSNIAEELIRDEEFTLTLLKELEKEGFVKRLCKNSDGKTYLARKKWLLRPKIYSKYKALYLEGA